MIKLTFKWIKFLSNGPYNFNTDGPISNSRCTVSGSNDVGSNSEQGLYTFFFRLWEPFGLIGDKSISSLSGVVISKSKHECPHGGDGWYIYRILRATIGTDQQSTQPALQKIEYLIKIIAKVNIDVHNICCGDMPKLTGSTLKIHPC